MVFKTGELDLYNILGEKVAYPPPVFGYPPPENKEIVDCEVFENMLIILTKENYFYYIRHLPNTSNFRPELIAKDDRNS